MYLGVFQLFKTDSFCLRSYRTVNYIYIYFLDFQTSFPGSLKSDTNISQHCFRMSFISIVCSAWVFLTNTVRSVFWFLPRSEITY